MPSGKSKSKENTWTEKDLTKAIQGDKPRRSKDERKERESKDDRPQKRRTREKDEHDRDKERDRRRHKSENQQQEPSLDSAEGHSSRSKDDGERKRKDRNKERQRDDDNGSGDRQKERRRKERNEEGKYEGGRRMHGEHSQKEKRQKERNGEVKYERSLDLEKSGRHREDDMESSRDRKDHNERTREKNNRGEEEDYEFGRKRNKDKRRHERDREEERTEKRERKRDKETEGKDHGRERHKHRDKSVDDNDNRKKARRRHEEYEDEDEKERRRRKKETAGGKNENGGTKREKNENESSDKERKREDKKTKEKTEEDRGDKQRRREERKKKKDHEQDGYENELSREERKDSKREVKEKELAGKLENYADVRSLSINNEADVDEEIPNDYDEDNYEDDFEDYDDDFEDEDEDDEEETGSEQDKGKLLEIFEAINAENDGVRRLPFQKPSYNDSPKEETENFNSKPTASSQGRINFFAAKKKHTSDVVASKTRKRAEELHNLIELDVASYDIFDLPPLNEYELYIKSYGQSDSKQAYVQCNDDIIEKEMQTEGIETCAKWTQYPPDDFKGCGEGDESRRENDMQNVSPHSIDSVRLTNFLQQAGQVCLILLEESVSARKDLMFKERNDIDISDGFIQLASKLYFLEGRPVLDMKFNSVQTHLLLTAHDCAGSVADMNDSLRGRGIVCYWNVNEPSQPQKILYCESSPNSCCFSPVKSSLVFAGLGDGSVVVWDVRESSSLHSIINNEEKQWVIRRPTFSTAGVLFSENHLCPVQSILPIALPIGSAHVLSRSSVLQDAPGGMAFQLASLDESGVVNIWVVIELDKPDEAGSENDLGLAPGGRVKLIRSTAIQVESPYREIFVGSTLQTSVMQFSTLDPNHFYIGTDRGWVVHCTRYGGRTHPKVYRPQTDSFVTISAIDISPWNIPVMLVGCKDGTLRLHDLRKENTIRCWPESTRGIAIVQLMWSKSRPSLFFVLDAKSNLYIWDLLQNESRPVATEFFKRGKLLFFSMSNDYESLGIGLPGRKSELVLNYEGGTIELHRLKETLITVQADELDRFTSLVDTFI